MAAQDPDAEMFIARPEAVHRTYVSRDADAQCLMMESRVLAAPSAQASSYFLGVLVTGHNAWAQVLIGLNVVAEFPYMVLRSHVREPHPRGCFARRLCEVSVG